MSNVSRRAGTVAALATLSLALLGCGGTTNTAGPGSTPPPGATAGPGATKGPAATTGGGTAEEGTATLAVTSTDISGSWTLDASGNVSPTATLIAAIWTETTSDPAGAFGDLITLTIGGLVVEGTQATSTAGLSLGFSINRVDAAGTDLYDYVFSSRGGECQITMQRTSTGVAGSYTCKGIKDAAGHSADATGTFAT